MLESVTNLIEEISEKEGVPTGIVFGNSDNYQLLNYFEFLNENKIDLENDNDAASDASYSTNNSEELPSDSKLPCVFEDMEEFKLESLLGLLEQADEDENNNEERGVNYNEEPGVDSKEKARTG